MEYMRKFLETNYSDEQLIALLDHLPTLSYRSCCCFVGGSTADHPLKGEVEYAAGSTFAMHLHKARELPFAEEAEAEFSALTLLPDWRLLVWFLIQEEITRRALARQARVAHEGDLVTA